jgi:hypothetical protein
VKKEGFETLRLKIQAALTRLVRISPTLLRPSNDLPAAAE